MGKRYAQILETMWFTYLYATLIPFGAFMTMIGLMIFYWVDKYNLLRRSSVNCSISGDLALFSMKLLDFTLVIKPLGEIIFDTQIRSTCSVESIILLCIGIIYMVIPIDQILQFMHDQKFNLEQKNYDEIKSKFQQTYQTLHPILSFSRTQDAKIYEIMNFEENFDRTSERGKTKAI